MNDWTKRAQDTAQREWLICGADLSALQDGALQDSQWTAQVAELRGSSNGPRLAALQLTRRAAQFSTEVERALLPLHDLMRRIGVTVVRNTLTREGESCVSTRLLAGLLAQAQLGAQAGPVDPDSPQAAQHAGEYLRQRGTWGLQALQYSAELGRSTRLDQQVLGSLIWASGLILGPGEWARWQRELQRVQASETYAQERSGVSLATHLLGWPGPVARAARQADLEWWRRWGREAAQLETAQLIGRGQWSAQAAEDAVRRSEQYGALHYLNQRVAACEPVTGWAYPELTEVREQMLSADPLPGDPL